MKDTLSKLSLCSTHPNQEEEFLRKNIQKITSLKPRPDVLVVEKSVSRLAQEFLLKAGITLIYNVKEVSSIVYRNFGPTC